MFCATPGPFLRGLVENFRAGLNKLVNESFMLGPSTLNSMPIMPSMALLSVFQEMLHRKMVEDPRTAKLFLKQRVIPRSSNFRRCYFV